jgi:hypothetical protein
VGERAASVPWERAASGPYSHTHAADMDVGEKEGAGVGGRGRQTCEGRGGLEEFGESGRS